MKNILKEIETKYPVDTILVNGEQVWPYLRLSYYYSYMTSAASTKDKKKSLPVSSLFLKLKIAAKMLRNSFYGLANWAGNYDYIVFSNTGERRDANGKYLNKLLDPFIDELGRDIVLYIENPAPMLYPARKVYTKHIVCHHLPELLSAILAKLLPRKYVIQNIDVLDSIQKEYGLEIDNVSRVKSFEAQRRIFRLFFRYIKPKAVLISCYYDVTNRAVVKSAKDLGIKVIEFQHGTISKEHQAYNVDIALDKTYFPDYLLVFGRKELETFDNSRFIDPQNVYPIGSFYLEYIKKNYKLERNFIELLKDYRSSVGVTLQLTSEKTVIEFIRKAAGLDCAIIYLLIPRRPDESDYSALDLPDNVMVITDKSFYELMMYVDFHSTVYSTCALEAPSLGVRNILINMDNQSKRYYGTVLTDDRVIRYANTPEELVSIINSFKKFDRDSISELNKDIISLDYKRNIKTFITKELNS